MRPASTDSIANAGEMRAPRPKRRRAKTGADMSSQVRDAPLAAGSQRDWEVQYLEAGIFDSGLVAIACGKRLAARARNSGNPKVVVGEVPAVPSAQDLQTAPLIDDREVEWDLEKAGESALLPFDARSSPTGV